MRIEKVVLAVVGGLMVFAGVAEALGIVNHRPGLRSAAVYLWVAGLSVTLLPLAASLGYLVYARLFSGAGRKKRRAQADSRSRMR